MKRKISSLLTPYLRIILPGALLAGAIAAPIARFFRSHNPNPGTWALSISLMCGLGAGFVSLLTYWYRSVSIDDGHLIVSNYITAILIPFSNIKDVTERRLRGHPVTVHLKEPAEFGDKFTFLAKSRSIVKELKELAEIPVK